MHTAIAYKPDPPILRDIVAEMAQYMVEHPGCTEDEMIQSGQFSRRQLERFGPEAMAVAGRSSVRRIAR